MMITGITGKLTHIAEPLRPLALPIAEVHADPDNARQHSNTNIRAIRSSLERFGQQKPIVIDADGRVVAGNGTLVAAFDLGWAFIAAVRTDFDEIDAVAYAIADNRTAELATWDGERIQYKVVHDPNPNPRRIVELQDVIYVIRNVATPQRRVSVPRASASQYRHG